MPTIADIAKKSGFSASTVSRVINDSANVELRTRKKIQKIIDELDYRPSHIARGLVTGRMNLVAFIIGDRWNPYYAELASAAEEELNSAGYLEVMCYTNYQKEKEEHYIEAAITYGFAGLVILTVPQSEKVIKQLKRNICPVVLVNRYLNSLDTDFVSSDNYEGGCIATRHLIEMGHRRIYHVAGPQDSTASHDRLRGFRDTMGQAGLSITDEVAFGDLRTDSGYRIGQHLVAVRPEITAAYVANDMMATGVVRAYVEAGKRIPEDFSIVGYDDSQIAVSGEVKLTTVNQHHLEMGKAAVDLILRRIDNPQDPFRRIILRPTLVKRSSVAYNTQ